MNMKRNKVRAKENGDVLHTYQTGNSLTMKVEVKAEVYPEYGL